MPSAPLRLAIALKPAAETLATIREVLPGLPWGFTSESSASDWGSVEAMLVGSVDRELGPFDAREAPRLRWVQLIYTGADRFPFERFPDPIRISANVGAYAPFVAEHAIALALAAARSLVPVQIQMHAHRLRPPPDVRLLVGRTALILGYGAIGREIARRAEGLGMRVIGLNRSGEAAPGVAAMYAAENLQEALAEGDVVFDARPHTRSTDRSIGAAELTAMPSRGIYINVGRAATADEEALYHHLRDHPEFRAAFDPWWEEDFAQGTFTTQFPLIDLPNFLGTPHNAGFGPATQDHALRSALDNVARFFRGETPLYPVDRREYEPLPTVGASGSVPARTSR